MEFEAGVARVAKVHCEEWSGFRSLESFRFGFVLRYRRDSDSGLRFEWFSGGLW